MRIKQYSIPIRTRSDAMYIKCNPHGDPFCLVNPKSCHEFLIYGIGLGLYWGEGTKASNSSIRLGNTDPYLIKAFIIFLEKVFLIKKSQLTFSLQLFTDINKDEALCYWSTFLCIQMDQFTKSTITKSIRKGTYKNKTKYGVLTLYFHNIKARKSLGELLDKFKNESINSYVPL